MTPGDAQFVDEVSSILVESGIDRGRAILELVGTTLIDLPARAQQAMRYLSGRGVRFAADDFGTGYSSLARLKDVPVQIIKIDRQFVTVNASPKAWRRPHSASNSTEAPSS